MAPDTEGEMFYNKREKEFDEEYDYKYLREELKVNKRKEGNILYLSQYIRESELLEK